MYIPLKAKITIGIIAGIGVGAGALAYGLAVQSLEPPAPSYMAVGAAALIGSVTALIAHLAGGFRDVRDETEMPLYPQSVSPKD
jgi:hypothetical protein